MTIDPLDDARTQIKRAKKKIKQLGTFVHNYAFRQPYRMIVEHDVAARKKVARLRIVEGIPDDADDSATAVLQHLRSALDYIAWAVANRSGVPAKPKSVAFPIYDDTGQTLGDAKEKRKIEQVGGLDWYAFLVAMKPYEGGNDLLHALNETNNVEKHRHLVQIGSVAGPTGKFEASLDSTMSFNAAMFIGPLEDGMELVTVTDSQADPKVTITAQIALRGIQRFERQPVVMTLNQFTNAVEDILTEARRTFFP